MKYFSNHENDSQILQNCNGSRNDWTVQEIVELAESPFITAQNESKSYGADLW